MDQQNISIALSSSTLNIDDAMKFVSSDSCGAISLFVGTTRINENQAESNKKVESLHYEAYEPMAISMMNQIVNDLINANNNIDHNDKLYSKIYIRHRVGLVPLGDSSIVIAISSPHRQFGHQMVMEVLNRIKQSVPIWKKIHYQSDDNNVLNQEWSNKSEAFWLKR